MFIEQSACAAALNIVKRNDREASRGSLCDIHLTREAMILIGLGIKRIASLHGLPENTIKQNMKKNLFLVPPFYNLYFLFHVPEIDADMHIAIPPCHWQLVK